MSKPDLFSPHAKFVLRLAWGCCLAVLVGFEVAQAQEIRDYTALGDPSYASRLNLSEQQQIEVDKILSERRSSMLDAQPDERAGVINQTNEKLEAILSSSQRNQFLEIVAGNKLRFTFRNEPWPEVLSWFAGQADLALVMNEAPTGVFNYSDSKNHTPSEAIDLLNGVLQSKGFTLVRRDKMLIVSPTADGVAYDQVPKISVDEIASRGRFEFVSVLFPLEGRPVESVLTEVSAFLGTNGRATPLPATGQLMVVDTAGRVEDIRKLIESIPKPAKKQPKPQPKPAKKEQKPPPVFQVHSAAGLDVDRAIETLRKLYGDASPITGDGRAEQITAYTPVAQQDAIAKTLQQMKANVTGDNQPRLQTYSVINQDLDQLTTLLAQANPGIQISTDRASSRLFVVGNARQQSGVQETLVTLDAVKAESTESVAVYEVRPELVNQFIDLLKPLIPQASVVANGNRVAVRGSSSDLQIAQSTIEQLDVAERNEEKPSLRFITLQEILQKSYLDSIRQLVPEARISEVPNRKQLAIVATEKQHQRIVEAIQRIETEVQAEPDLDMQQFDVSVDEPDRLLAMLKSEFPDNRILLTQEKDGLLVWATADQVPEVQSKVDELSAVLPGKREPTWKSYSAESIELTDMQTLLRPVVRNAQFKPEPQRKRMMIWATGEEHEKIDMTLAAFGGADNTQFRDVLLAYPINRGDVAAVVSMLRGLRPDIEFAADESANRILVTAPVAEQQRIKGIIEQLDTAQGEQTGNIARSYSVESIAPSTVMQLVQPLVPKLRMTPNQRSIAALGSARDHERLADAIEQFEKNGGKKSVIAYDVGSANASQVSSILQQLVPGLWVSVNQEKQTVIVWASEADHAKAKQAIDQFTKEGTSQRTTEIYRFDRQRADSMERVFERLAPRARVSRIYGSNSLIATATPAEHALFRELNDKMKTGAGEMVTRVYPVDKDHLNVDDLLASIDEALMSRLSIRTNEQTNSLIVRGGEEDQAQLKQLIDELVAKVPAKREQVVKVYSLEHADADNARYLMRNLFPEARIISDDQAGTIAATATTEQHEEIAGYIEQIDVPGTSEQITEIYRFSRSSARAAEFAFERLARRARVSYLPRTNSVIATATAEDHAKFREVVKKMEGDQSDLVTKVYGIDKERMNADDVLDSIDDGVRDRISVRMNEQTNSLIVRGSSADQAEIKQLIEGLMEQVPERRRRIAKVYPFENGDSGSVRNMLYELFEDIRVSSNDYTGTLAVTALPEQHTRIEDLVKQMDAPGQKARQITEIYRFDRTSGRAARDAFERIAPRARISHIDGTNSVMVTATEAEHKLFEEAAEKLNGGESGSQSITKVYQLDKKKIDAEDVIASIDDSLRSRLALRVNEQTNSLIVRGSESDQATMKDLIDQIMALVPPKDSRVAKVYPMEFGNPRNASYALRNLLDNADITYDTDTDSLIATATNEDHETIASLVKQMDVPGASGKSTKVYPVESATASQVYPAISDMVDDGRVTYNNESNVLIVTAATAKHEEIQQVLKDLNNAQSSDTATKVYALKSANPGNIQGSLERLMPQIRVASDASSGALIVAANESDHERVSNLVEQLDQAPGQEAKMQAYSVKSGNSREIFDSLTQTFNGNGNFSLSFQEPTGTIFLVATPKNHQVFSDLMEQLDKPELSDKTRTAKTYSLTNLSGNSAKNAITSLLQGTSPAPSIELDALGNSLILVGTEQQHQRVADTLSQLAGEASELEVFDLEYVDPWTVESAVDSLFANQPASSAPTMTSDYFSSRLFVRGNQEQIEQIRSLLVKMGETSVIPREDRGKADSDVRTIPFKGDVATAIQQIQSIWPRMRKNRIEVVAPADPTLRIDDTHGDPAERRPSLPFRPTPVDDEDNSVSTGSPLTRYVVLQTSTRAPAERDRQQSKDASSPSDRSQEERLADLDDVEEIPRDVSMPEDTPVVIVPEEDQITIASTDHEALDQLEELLRAISRSSDDETSSYGADFAVFLLRNTGASDMRQLLGDLFGQLRKNDGASASSMSRDGRSRPPSGFGMGGGFGSLFGPSFGNVAVVADDRLNALIIHGDRKERELIKELLQVLDTKELANPIVVYQPELVRLQNTQADRVLRILQNVYKSQLQSGGGRRRVDIPEGVSSEVASVLQQINAAAGAPVLTLDVDSTTNSIVMRAPPELRQEIKVFVSSLDQGAGTNRSRNVRVIRLRRGKSDQIRDALQEFILERNGSR